jgi:hypothetical protein
VFFHSPAAARRSENADNDIYMDQADRQPPDSRTARLTMRTATEPQQRHALLSVSPAPRHLSASMRSLRSIAATQFRRSCGPVVGGPAVLWSRPGVVKFRHFQGNPGFFRPFEGRKKSCRHHGPTPALPHQAYSSPIKVRQNDAQPRQRHNTSQLSATAAGPSDFRISAFQFSAFSPNSSPIKANQGVRSSAPAEGWTHSPFRTPHSTLRT